MPMSGLAQEIHGAMALLAVSAARMGARQSALKLRVPSLRAGLGVMIRAPVEVGRNIRSANIITSRLNSIKKSSTKSTYSSGTSSMSSDVGTSNA